MTAITNLRDWRALRRKTYIIGGSLEVQTRQVSLIDLVAQGHIPKPLLGMIQSLSVQQQAGKNAEVKLDEFPDYARTINAVVKAMIVSPPVLTNEEAETLYEQITATFPSDGMVQRSQIRSWVNAYISGGEPAPELELDTTPRRAVLIGQLADSLLIDDIPLQDKIEMFQSVAGEATIAAPFSQ